MKKNSGLALGKRLVVIVALFLCLGVWRDAACSFMGMPLPMPSAGREFGLSFLRSSDAGRMHEHISREQQLSKLQAYKEALAVRAAHASEKMAERLRAFTEERSRLASFGAEVERLLTDRAKVAAAVPETYDELRKLVDKHETLLKQFIGVLDQDIKQVDEYKRGTHQYTWEQFKAAQQELEEQKGKRGNLREQHELAARDLVRIKEEYGVQRKQYVQEVEALNKKIVETNTSAVREQYRTQASLLYKLQEELTELGEVQEERAERQSLLRTDELAFHEYVIGERKRVLPLIRERLAFSQPDIDLALQELKNEEARSQLLVGRLEEDLKRLKTEREQLEQRKQSSETVSDQSLLAKAQREKLEQEIHLRELQRLMCLYKRELSQGAVEHRKLQLNIVEIMHQRSVDQTGKIVEQRIDSWLQQFLLDKNSIGSFLGKLADRVQEQQLRAQELHKYAAVVASKASDRRELPLARLYMEIGGLLVEQQRMNQEIFSLNSQQIKQQKAMSFEVQFVLAELERDKRSLNIWQRSDRALSSGDLTRAWTDAKRFGGYMLRTTMQGITPTALFREIRNFTPYDLALLFLMMIFLCLFVFGVRQGLFWFGGHLDQLLYIYQGQVLAIYLTFARSVLRFFETYATGLGVWLFVRLHIAFEFSHIFSTLQPLVSPYSVSMFCLMTIPFFVYISRQFMVEFKKINQRMSFLFFTEKLQDKFLFLMTSILYSSAILMPLRKAFLYYPFSINSPLPDVIRGGWILIVTLVILFCFSKEDIFRFLPSQGPLGQWLQERVDKYYYPVFIFTIGLCILVNPYVGYTNFAVYLAICIPLTFVILYALFKTHNYIRRYSFFIFMKEVHEEEEGVVDRFENAKMYYGVFIIFTFLTLSLAAFVFITRIWGLDYTVARLWQGLSHDWVINFEGTGVHIGFGGVLTLCVFMFGGFVVSSFFNRFVLMKLYDIFRVEYGAQNTASKLLHYLFIVFSIVLGLHAIRLSQLGNWVLFGLMFGIAFGLKDLVADFFAGLWVLFERPIELGHYVQIGELRGTVNKIAMRATTIRTPNNHSVVLPNRELVSKPILNWGAGYYAVGFEFSVPVPYESNPDEVKDLIAQVTNDNKLVLRIPAATIRLEEFEENGYRFFVRAYISSRRVRDQWDIASQIRLALAKEFTARGIKIPYPHRRIIHSIASFEEAKQQFDRMKEEHRKEGR